MTTRLILVRGLPGSGKSTFGEEFGHSIAADDYFMEDGEYCFDPSKLPEAHSWCLEEAAKLLGESKAGEGFHVCVCNTFTQRWEMQPYFEMAEREKVRVTVVDLYDGGCTDQELFERNVHGVPLPAFEAMRARYESDWKNGDTRPPWER